MITVYNEIEFHKRVAKGNTLMAKQFAFILLCEGYLHFEVNGVLNQYQKGNVIIITTNSLYKMVDYDPFIKLYILTGDREELRENLTLNFNRYDLYRISHNIKGRFNLVFQDQQLSRLVNAFEQLYFYANTTTIRTFQDQFRLLFLSVIIYTVFGKLIDEFGNQQSKNTRKEEIVLDFIRLLEDNYKTERELAFYADALHLSIKYLSNCVREVTGIPPTQFIQERVLNSAKLALLNKKDPINIIAADLGFSDQYSFGTFFKKHIGLSPKHFREENATVKEI